MTVSMVNILLDLLSSAPEHQYYEQLRAEAKSVFQSEKDWTDPASLAKLPLTDSAIRESLRRDPINVRDLLREVVQKDGMKLPDGSHVAKGAWLGIPQRNVHMNERFYSNPEEHKPFRFARSRQDSTLLDTDRDTLSDKASRYRNNVALPVASDIFMAWGHGRHAR